MQTISKLIKGWGLVLALAVMFGLMLGTGLFNGSGLVTPAEAALSKATSFTIGEPYSTGNTTGTTTGVRVSASATRDEVPTAINCFFTITNTENVTVANTATVVIETSADNTFWDTYKTVTVAASTVTGIYQTPGLTVPVGSWWRYNVTALQNTNDSYVRGKCLVQ